jgi:hypothetical protein
MNGYMLDTTVFNHILEGHFGRANLPPGNYFATPVQWKQIVNTPDPQKRAQRVGMFTEIDPKLLPPSTPAWYSGPASIGGLYEPLQARLKELDKKSGKRPRGDGRRADVLIAETAILRHLVLITGDGNLVTVVKENGGQAYLTPHPRRKTKLTTT